MGLKKKTNLNYEIVLISAPGTLFIAERTSTKFEIVSLHYALILQSVQCFKMKFTGIGLLALIFCHLSTFGQVRKLALITDRNFNQISFLDQLKFIEKSMERDNFMDSEMAKSFGLIDEVISDRERFFKK
ncbi:MAG: hypothetical protein EBR41_05805 [Crocinitomicaceae bacterium]|nr:hypothetical protein [Crocinitomicaceae bacterium]